MTNQKQNNVATAQTDVLETSKFVKYCSIKYEEIIKSWNTCTDMDFWNKLKYIADNIPNSKSEVNFLERALRFVNTYILESSVIDSFTTFAFYDCSHYAFHTGKGANSPDFRIHKPDKTIKTAELKMVKHLGLVEYYEKKQMLNWHDADVRLVYDLYGKKLYHLRRDKSMVYKENFQLVRPLLKLKDAKIFDIITEEEKRELGLIK